MSSATQSNRYGVLEQTSAKTENDRAAESISILGYAVVPGGYDSRQLELFSAAFDRAHAQAMAKHGGFEALAEIDEHNTIRAALAYDDLFLQLAANPNILQVCRRLIANYIVLSQQNGIINPPKGGHYNQGAWHRDLPYQHFVSSRPLAVNALFCLDRFTNLNGATQVLPGTHRQEAFPSDSFIEDNAVTVEAEAGSFILLDCMAFHRGSENLTDQARRAVNHVYTIPMMRQQIDLPNLLGERFVSDAELRLLLGYGVRTPPTIADFLEGRRDRTAAKM
jgi:ectoine hydroxylase-related dioxygenase (phytanoyl-CoA dioxygenase family)